MIRNQYLSKYITSQCSELSPYFSPIHNGYLIIMFYNLRGTVGFGRFEHGTASGNIKKFSRILDYISCVITFSHSS